MTVMLIIHRLVHILTSGLTFLVSDNIFGMNFSLQANSSHFTTVKLLTKQARATIFSCEMSRAISSSSSRMLDNFHRPLHLRMKLYSCRSPVTLRVSLHVRRCSCVEMTGFSTSSDTFGSLFSPSIEACFIPVGRHHSLSLDFHTL